MVYPFSTVSMNDKILPYREVSTKEIFDNPDAFLDDILDALLLKYEKDPFPIPREIIIAQKQIQLSHRDTHVVLKKLCKDGYADTIPDIPGFGVKYYITFEGAKFLHDGGYVTARENVRRQSQIERMKNNLLILGSWMAGVGTLLLFCMEAVKYWKLIGLIDIWTAFFLLLCCNIGILLVWLLIRQIKSSRNGEHS